MSRKLFLIYSCAILAACTPAHDPLDERDAGTTIDTCTSVCAHLEALGCPEGSESTCVRGCTTMVAISTPPIACWIGATSADAVRACGGVRCSR